MINDMMNFQRLLAKSSDTDLLLLMVSFAAQCLIDLEVEGLTVAGHGERSAERTARGAGHDHRRVGGRIFWTHFLRTLARRGLRGVKLVISDAHEGLKAAISKVLTAT